MSEPEGISPLDAMRARMSRREQKQMTGEQLAVRSLMTCLKLPPKVKDRLYTAARSAGRESPMLLEFNEHMAECPVYFAYREHKELRSSASLGELFPASKFASKWFVKAYIETRKDMASYDEEKPLCLLFSWPYMEHPMVMHSLSLPQNEAGLRLSLKLPDESMPKIILEPLEQLATFLSAYLSNGA